jgi:sugar phosphate isomerase/epimerase
MRFGASTYFVKELSVTGALALIARLGYDTAEIWMEHALAAGQRAATIARQAGALGIGLTVHAASYDLNPLSINRGIRHESFRQIEAACRFASAVGAPFVTVHPGRLSTARQGRENGWQRLEELAARLDDWAGRYGVGLGIENMENEKGEIFCLPEDVAALFKTPYRCLRLTLDLAHARTFMDPVAYLGQIRTEWIGHVHLSGNSAAATHLPLGEGRMEIRPLLAALGRVYAGIVSLEGYRPGEGESLLRRNRDFLRTTLGTTSDFSQ